MPARVSRSVARYQEQGSRREAILLAAARLFRERGLERTTLDDIAQALGVSKPTLYYHMGNKDMILAALQEFGLRRVLEGSDELLAEDSPALDRLRRFMLRYGEWVTSEFGVCVVRLIGVDLAPENHRQLRRARRAVNDIVERLLRAGARDGSIAPCDPRLASAALFGAFNWLTFWYDARRDGPSPTRLADQYLTLFFDGLAPSEATPGTEKAGRRSARLTRPRG